MASGQVGPLVTWTSADGAPSCVWHPRRHEVEANLRITGSDVRPTRLAVTVTAHRDENTSRPVGSASRTVHVEGTVDRTLRMVFGVSAAPYVDIDGVAACSLDVTP